MGRHGDQGKQYENAAGRHDGALHWYAMPPKRAIPRAAADTSRVFARAGGVIASARPLLADQAMTEADLTPLLQRIADALERLAPTGAAANDLDAADAFVWHAEREWCEPVAIVNRVPIALLRGIDRVRDILLENTGRFAAGLPANNVLLWGARGTGKSALVKAAHAAVNEVRPHALALIEIHREDIPTLPRLLSLVRASARRCLLFCDDLSFDQNDASYKSLKAVLEGGIEGRPGNVVLYATSNRRHLMAREMIENERSTAINPAEAVEEKVSLSDRFGLWLGFHNVDQDTYQAIVAGYALHYGLDLPVERLRAEAGEWSITRGARSGRVAWQFIQDLAGRLGKPLL
jgi:predicted AAA+ superfamily ATPase